MLRDDKCRFCKIVWKEEPAYMVFEDEDSVAFLDIRPLFPGHCLLIPRAHYRTIVDLPLELVPRLFINVRLLAHAVEIGLSVDGSFVAINNRVSQSIPHLHIHIVPRRRRDGLRGFFWPRQRYKDTQSILEVQDAIRSAISHLASSHNAGGL